MKTNEKVKVNPSITGLDEWIEGVIIDVENNPFRGIVISIKDAEGRIFFGDERYFEPLKDLSRAITADELLTGIKSDIRMMYANNKQ
jgi:hypothetical protein